MNTKILTILLIVSVAINLVAVLTFSNYLWQEHNFWRGNRPDMMGPMPDWRQSPLRYKLNLTEEQIARLNAIQDEMDPRILPLHDELSKTRKELVALWKEPKPDAAKTDSLFQKLMTLQTELEKQVFSHLRKMNDVLTQEQRKKMFAFLERGPMFPPRMMPGEEIRHKEGDIK